MLFEGYELYLESIALLLVAFVFLFLVLLTLVEWSGSKPMAQDRAEHEVPEDEADKESNPTAQSEDAVGSNYNNKAPASESQMLIDRYIGKVDFNMKSEDLDKPWFHKQVTRAMAQELLKGQEQGSFIVRPSSQRGSYAMSWVKNAQSGEISHSLIHGLFPGFSLKQCPSLEERFWSLQSLVDNCPHLLKPIVSGDYIANKGNFQRTVARTRYCDEEYAAPELLPLNGNGLELVCQALQNNTTLRSLTITGHEGYMRMSFKPNIGDSEASIIAKMLQANRTLTSLELNINQITDLGAKVIAQGLKFNRTLRKLNLSNNFLSSEGLGFFADLLKSNPTLEDLDVRNQLHKNRANSVTLSIGDNTKQLISLIEETMRRRAELVSPIGFNSPGGVSSASPARSSFLAVFHGYLSKKKVERRLAPHLPGSFLFYLNRNIPSVMFIGVVQDVPHTHYATQFHHEIESTTQEHPAPKQIVPSLFEYCAWYISSNKLLLEYIDQLEDEVLDRLKGVQTLVGLWGVKFFLPPSSTPSPSSSSSNSPSHKSGHSSRSHSSHSHHSSRHSHHSSHSPKTNNVAPQASNDPHYSSLSNLSLDATSSTPNSTSSPTSSTPTTPTASTPATPTTPTTPTAPTAPTTPTTPTAPTAPTTPTTPTTPTAPFTPTTPTPTSTPNPKSPDANSTSDSDSNTDSETTTTASATSTPSESSPAPSLSSSSDPNNNNNNSSSANNANHSPQAPSPSTHASPSAHANGHNTHHHHAHHNNHHHHAHTNTHNHHNHNGHHASSSHSAHPSAHSSTHSATHIASRVPNNANVYSTLIYLVHRNRSWLKYPVQVPQQDPPR